MKATNDERQQTGQIAGCVCPRCYKPLAEPTMLAETDSLRKYFGFCGGCGVGSMVIQFLADGRWVLAAWRAATAVSRGADGPGETLNSRWREEQAPPEGLREEALLLRAAGMEFGARDDGALARRDMRIDGIIGRLEATRRVNENMIAGLEQVIRGLRSANVALVQMILDLKVH